MYIILYIIKKILIILFLCINIASFFCFGEESKKPNNSDNENALQDRLDSYPVYSEEWFLLKALNFSRTEKITEKLQIIKETEELARDCQDTETKARLLHEVGSYYYGVGDAITEPDMPEIESYYLQAVESFNKVLELKPTSEKVVCSTLRQLAQLNASVILDKPEVAVQYYEELEKRLTSGTNSLRPKTLELHLRDVYAKLAPLKDKLGDKDGAVAVHTRALKILPDPTSPEDLLLKARRLDTVGQKEEAQECYSRLYKEFPNYGRDDGQIISIMQEQARASRGIVSTNRVPEEEMLFAFWKDPENQKHPQIIGLGYNLAYLLAENKDERFSSFAAEYRSRLEESLKTNSVDNIKKYRLKSYEGYLLSLFVRDAFGDYKLEKERILEYIKKVPDGPLVSSYMSRYEFLEKELVEEETLKAKQWRTRFFAFLIVVVAFIPVYFLSRSRWGSGGNPV